MHPFALSEILDYLIFVKKYLVNAEMKTYSMNGTCNTGYPQENYEATIISITLHKITEKLIKDLSLKPETTKEKQVKHFRL